MSLNTFRSDLLSNRNPANHASNRFVQPKIPGMCNTRQINSKYSDELITEVIDHYSKGNSLLGCSKRFGIAKDTIFSWINGISRKHVLIAYEKKNGPIRSRYEN